MEILPFCIYNTESDIHMFSVQHMIEALEVGTLGWVEGFRPNHVSLDWEGLTDICLLVTIP